MGMCFNSDGAAEPTPEDRARREAEFWKEKYMALIKQLKDRMNIIIAAEKWKG
jgi:hypothetical protein